MFTKALLPDTIRAFKLVSNINIVKKSYLAGGTALALHFGHRISVDLDFFTSKVFDEKTLSGELNQMSEYKEDIAAMKIHALKDRGTKRDFIDLYFLAKEFSFEQMLKFFDQKYGVLKDQLYMILRSMEYFEDAEMDKMPEMLIPVSWDEVKKFFQDQVILLAKVKLNIEG